MNIRYLHVTFRRVIRHVDIDIRDSPHTKWVGWSHFPELIDTVTVPRSTVTVSYNHNSSCPAMSLTAWRRSQCQGCPPASILSPRSDWSHSLYGQLELSAATTLFLPSLSLLPVKFGGGTSSQIKLGVFGSNNLIITTDFFQCFFRRGFMLLIYLNKYNEKNACTYYNLKHLKRFCTHLLL